VHLHHRRVHIWQIHPPSEVPIGQWFTISFFLTNEFGLWRRDDFPPPPFSLDLILTTLHPSAITLQTNPPNPAIHPGGTPRTTIRLRFIQSSLSSPVLSQSDQNCVHLVAKTKDTSQLFSRDVLPVVSIPIRLLPPLPEESYHGDEDYCEDEDVDEVRQIHVPVLKINRRSRRWLHLL